MNNIINEVEREHLLDNMKKLLSEYDYRYSESALNDIIDEWSAQKEELIEAFRKHPNYIGNFMIVYDYNYERVVDERASSVFGDYITDLARIYRNDVLEEIKERREQDGCSWLPKVLFDFFANLKNYAARTVSEEVANLINSVVPEAHVHTGEKMSRAVNKICKYLGYDKDPDYNREFAKYADSLSPMVIKRHTVLSVNPLDYLTMSFGNSWASCHTIDKHNLRGMPNSYEGQYSSGTMSYMLDGSSMVFYTVDASYDGTEYWDQPKINRQMFHYGEDKLVQSRLYPQDNDYGSDSLYDQYRAIVQNIISTCFGFPNLWRLRKGSRAASEYIDTEGTHYDDYAYVEKCTLSILHGSNNENSFTVGASPICIECGCIHDVEENINCCSESGGCYCDNCGDYISEDDAIYVGDYVYCRDCVEYCNYCEEYHRGDSTYVYGYGDVCDDCLSAHFEYCEDCDSYVHDDNAYWIDGCNKWVCRDCIDEYTQCDECEEYYHNDDITEVGNRCLCPNCYEDECEEESDEAC